MNVFLAGYRPDRPIEGAPARAAMQRWCDAYADFDAAPVGSWVAPRGDFVASWASHASAGDVTYAASDDRRFATFAGRPYLWTDEVDEVNGTVGADGRRPLDAHTYLPGIASIRDRIDGRTAIVRYADGEVSVYTDHHGTLPVYTATADGITWISNNAPLLYELVGRGATRRHVLSSYFAFGWAIGGEPLWEPVERIAKGAFVTLSPARTSVDIDASARLGPLFGQGWDAVTAARTMVAAVAALADWPGRPNLIAVTGGRDSRVVVAAAMRAGIAFDAMTHAFPHEAGFPDTADATVAREVCRVLGIGHQTTRGSPDDAEYADPRQALARLQPTSPGTIDLEDAQSLWSPLPLAASLPMLMSGVGGEFARSVWGHARGVPPAALPRLLFRQAVKAWLQPPLLNEVGRADVMRCLGDFVERNLDEGVAPEDIPDTFFAEQLSGREATKSLAYDVREEAVCPMLSRRLLPHQVGLSQPERTHDIFHLEVLRQLAPELVDLPFAGDKPRWPSLQSEEERRAEHQQRVERSRSTPPSAPAGPDVTATVRRLTREAVADQPGHAAWEVLDRDVVDQLLAEDQDPATRGKQAGFHLWWLATMFL